MIDKHTMQNLRARFDRSYHKISGGCWIWDLKLNSRYGRLGYHKNGKIIMIKAHRLSLLLHGKSPPHNYSIACHSCDHTDCVNPDHLYWGTWQSNMDDKVSRGRHMYGDNHYKSKLCRSDVVHIRDLYYDKGWKLERLSAHFGVSRSTITCAVVGASWKSVPFSPSQQAKLGKMHSIRHGNAKLTEDQVLAIKKLLLVKGVSTRKLARRFNTSTSTIRNISSGYSWSSVRLSNG